MSDFRTKLFGLAAVATVFAGMSYGQVACTNTGGAVNTGAPLLLRAESLAELVSDPILTCTTSGSPISNGQLTVYASAPVTSKAITVVGGNSEAVLQVFNGATAAPSPTTLPTNVYPGTVAGTTVSFNGVSFPSGPFVAVVSNVRVNATTLGVTSSPVAVTESIFAGSNGVATVNLTGIQVGFALKSLVAPAFVLNTSTNLPQIARYTVCTGNPASSSATPGLSFTVIAAEAFGGAFKTQTGGGVIQNGEQGSFPGQTGASTVTGVGTANSGTQISLTFANLPSVATVYVPVSVQAQTGTTAASTLIPNTGIQLVGATVATSPSTVTSLPGSGTGGAAGVGVVAYTPSSGSLTVTYTVTQSTAASIENFLIPVYVSFPANSAAAQGPITVLEAYAPTGTLTGQASSVPLFAASSNTPLNASSITVCSTSILFPFITNQSGYDTGIAIANTSTDPLGTAGASAATPQNGTCTLSFYGAGAPTPATYTTPAIGPATTTTYAFTLSSGAAPGFQGYAIAVCNFLYGHGFAFITNSATAGSSGVAQGYLGLVIGSRPSLGESLSE